MESSNFLMSMKQVATPLNKTFFSHQNLESIQNMIRSTFQKESGLKLDRQNDNDIIVIMRKVFIDKGNFPYDNVCGQVRVMNEAVTQEALRQIRTNVSQYMTYVRDMDKPIMPPAIPTNTSIYGMRIADLKF